jgi:hypothetical protein
MNPDQDIVAVRELTDERGTVTDESVARVWYTISRRQAVAARTHRSGWVVGVAAAASIAVVATGGAVMAGLHHHRSAAPVGGTASVAASLPGSASPSASPQRRPGTWPSLDPSGMAGQRANTVEGAPVPIAQAWQELISAAGHAPPALAVAPGQYLYLKAEGYAGRSQSGVFWLAATRGQDWFDPQGMVEVRMIRDGLEVGAGPTAGAPGVRWPTPQWLAGLPRQPQQLLSLLRAQSIPSGPGTDDSVWDQLATGFLRSCDPLLAADVRTALLQALRSMSGLTALRVTIDGRPLLAIRRAIRHDGEEILFDPATGRAAGMRDVQLGPGDQLVPTGAVGAQELWMWTVVDSTQQTG